MSTEAGDLSLLNKYQSVNAEHRTNFIVMHLQDLSIFQIWTKYQHVSFPWVLQKSSEMIAFRYIILSHENKADMGSIFLSGCAGSSLLCAGFLQLRQSEGYSLLAVRRLLTAVSSLVAAHGLWSLGFSSCGAWAQLLQSVWDLPRPGIAPMSPTTGRQILYHWAAGEVAVHLFLKSTLCWILENLATSEGLFLFLQNRLFFFPSVKSRYKLAHLLLESIF